MDLNIEWCEPYKIKAGVIDNWRRIWLIPSPVRNAFFEFWREAKFQLLTEGFRVYKEGDGEWYLSETKISKLQFKNIGITRSSATAPVLSDFLLPVYDISDNSGLRPWQAVAAGKIVSALNQWDAAIDGSDTGTGKTFSACAVARDLGMKMVVICPKAVISQWNHVVKNHFKMGDKLIAVTNYEQLRIGKTSSKLASYVIPRDTRRKTFQWKIPKNTLIIWDESQKLKNWKTKNAKTCIEAFKQGYKQLFCSATNATNPLELRTVGTCLKLFKGNQQAWFQWLNEHGCYKGVWGMEFTTDNSLRKKVLKKLNKDIFLDRGVRLRRDNIPNFPECDLFAVLLDMEKEDTNKINSIYTEMEKELKQLEQLQKKNKHHLVVELRYRQQIELVKVPLFIDMIEEAKEEGFSVVVFVNFTETINAIAKRLNISCIFDGKVGDSARELSKQKFQNNEEQVILVNVMSGGGGLSLHDLHGGHPRMSLISPSYSPVNMRQAIGRIWRDDAKTKAVQKLVCVAHTVEENVYNNVIKKLNNLDLLNDGDLAYSKNYEVVHN
jgi:superfamily II DNA or RNA helicase